MTTADAPGTRVHLHAYRGNHMSLFVDGEWVPVRIDQPIALDVSSVGPTAIFDVFLRQEGAENALSLIAWGGLARDVELGVRDGILVSPLDPSRRYLGTARTNGNGEVEDGQQKRFLWNAENRVARRLLSSAVGPPAGWFVPSGDTYSSPPPAFGSAGVELVIGRNQETRVDLGVRGQFHVEGADVDARGHLTIGVDGSLAPTPPAFAFHSWAIGYHVLSTSLKQTPNAGHHTYRFLHLSQGGPVFVLTAYIEASAEF